MGRFNNRQGIQLPGPQIPEQPMGLMVSQPFNDLQVVMLVAAAVPGTAKERVAMALDIVEVACDQQLEIQRRIGLANAAAVKRFETEKRLAREGVSREAQDEPQGVLIAP